MKKQMLKRTYIFILASVMIGMTACDQDDNNVNPDSVNAENATMVSFRTQTPTERIYYMGVYSEIPSELSTSNAVELGANQRIFSFGKHPYTWNGNASTLTKWSVNETDLNLTPEAIMGVAGIGISGDLGEPAFVSESEAYFFALNEGKVIEFNPTDMTITKTHDVTPITFPGAGSAGWYDVWTKYEKGNNVIMPIGYYTGSNWDIPTGAQVAVFNIISKTITYQQDDRLLAAAEAGVLSNNDEIYLQPAYGIDFAVHYGNHTNTLPTMTTLKMNDDGTFDQSFSYDFESVINTKMFRAIPIIFDNQAVVTVAEPTYDFPADPADRWDFNNINLIVDMDTDEVSEFTALDNYEVWWYSTKMDNTNYYVGTVNSAETMTTFLLRQNAIDNYIEVSKFVGGQIQGVAKLW